MEIKGTIIHITTLQSGSGSSGKAWQKQDLLIDQGGQYPKKVLVTLFGDKLTPTKYKEGESIIAHVNAETKTFNDKFFTTLTAWKLERDGITQPYDRKPEPEPVVNQSEEDNLPF